MPAVAWLLQAALASGRMGEAGQQPSGQPAVSPCSQHRLHHQPVTFSQHSSHTCTLDAEAVAVAFGVICKLGKLVPMFAGHSYSAPVFVRNGSTCHALHAMSRPADDVACVPLLCAGNYADLQAPADALLGLGQQMPDFGALAGGQVAQCFSRSAAGSCCLAAAMGWRRRGIGDELLQAGPAVYACM
jgi:hypothetical protein